jgi:hypothetical protein
LDIAIATFTGVGETVGGFLVSVGVGVAVGRVVVSVGIGVAVGLTTELVSEESQLGSDRTRIVTMISNKAIFL